MKKYIVIGFCLLILIIIMILLIIISRKKNLIQDTSSDISSSNISLDFNSDISSLPLYDDENNPVDAAKSFLEAYYETDVTQFNSQEHFNKYAPFLSQGGHHSFALAHPDDVKTDPIQYKSIIYKMKMFEAQTINNRTQLVVFLRLHVIIEKVPSQVDNMIVLTLHNEEDGIWKVDDMPVNENMYSVNLNDVFD